MANDEFWLAVEQKKSNGRGRSISALRLSVLFATAAVAVAMVLTPILAQRTTEQYLSNAPAPNWSQDIAIDNITTGSIPLESRAKPSKKYTIRRSITQTNLNEPCLIYSDGEPSKSC